MSDTEGLRKQLDDMQSQLAFQDDMIQSLNEALAEQQREFMTLRRQLELLKQRQDEHQAANNDQSPDLLDEKPPHY